MRKLRLLWKVIRRCNAEKLTIGYFASILIVALIIMINEPNINTYGDSLWYTIVASTTIGFGDLVVTTTLSKILTVYITFYSLTWMAIMSGVVVTHYQEVVATQERITATQFLDKLEHLTDLNHDELKDMQDKVAEIKKNLKKDLG
ncbi:MAG: potassium channel family protein [Lachnospiraceae bacterium]|nr:potassium channel family protein [Lachnospiraceae bacterium]